MRIVHTSDWHLGQELYGFTRTREHELFLGWLADTLVRIEADALLVTGDVFDGVNPPTGTVRQLYRFLQAIETRCPGLEIVLIGGNHDSAGRLEMPLPLLAGRGIHVIGSMPRSAGQILSERTLVPLHDKRRNVRVVCGAVPFLRAGDLPAVDSDDPARGVRELYQAVADAAAVLRGTAALFLTGHLHVQGALTSELSERPIVVGGEAAVPVDVFPTTADYVALGHLHRPQAVGGRAAVRYAGSPFPLSVAERNYRHSVVVIDLSEDNQVTAMDCLPIPRTVDYIRIPAEGAGSVEEVLEALSALPAEPDPGIELRPFVELAVRLAAPEPDLRQRIDAALQDKPIRFTRVNKATDGSGGALADRSIEPSDLAELQPEDVFVRCHEAQFQTAPSDGMLRAFREILAVVDSPADADGEGAV